MLDFVMRPSKLTSTSTSRPDLFYEPGRRVGLRDWRQTELASPAIDVRITGTHRSSIPIGRGMTLISKRSFRGGNSNGANRISDPRFLFQPSGRPGLFGF